MAGTGGRLDTEGLSRPGSSSLRSVDRRNSANRYGQTVYLSKLQGSRAVPLQRLRLDARSEDEGYDENWLQRLLFETPEVLPIAEIDPAFGPAFPLCRELPTAAGRIDLAYVSDQGRLTFVECKLWRNPEARRIAVTQILDCAKEISRWSYQRLSDAVGRAVKRPGTNNALFELVREQDDTIEEQTFVDDVTRNLKCGRFLLLVVGDGIREGVERIADYLQQSAGIRFTFGLVELAIFEMPDDSAGGIIVEPRVLAKTIEIERAVVRSADAGVVVEDPPSKGTVSLDSGGRRAPITETEFFEQISEIDSALPERLRDFFERCRRDGLEVTLSRASHILHWLRDDGRRVNFGTLFPSGDLHTNYIVDSAKEIGDPQIGVDYLEAVASLIPRARVKMDGNYWTWCVVVDGRKPKIADVLKRSDEWLDAMERAIDAFRKRLDK